MKCFNIGKPFETDSIIDFEHIIEVGDIEALFVDSGYSIEISDQVIIKRSMDKSDTIYGLGENMRGINKRGGIYESFCTDDPTHQPDRKALYGAHNFFVLNSNDKYIGCYIDFPSKVEFDFGFTHKDEIKVTVFGNNLKIYIDIDTDIKQVISKFLKAIGPSFLPPKWAFGFQQSRWSYPNKDAIKKIGQAFNQHDIPCDAIYLDIDYMNDYKNFTVDSEKFPDFKSFVSEMKTDGFRLIPIIDAGCKIEDDYFIHEEGISNQYYCTNANDKPFVGAVWPGKVHFPDFINPEVRKWFGNHYSGLIDQGIEGFWNDMNEPAIFYSEERLQEAFAFTESMKDKNLGIYEFFDLKDQFLNISNNDKDYKAFYHKVDGKQYNHYDLHNLYGYNMTRAAGEAFETNYPDKRLLLFSRASYIGMHRYGGIWTGDNHAWWEHLLLNIKMMPSLNMCGFLYSGADIGGFGGHASGELLTRWSQFAVYTPLFRNHACMGTRHQEPFSFENETTDTLRNTIRFRYAMINHVYSEFMKCRNRNDMLFRPLAFDYSDQHVSQVEDQLMYGSQLMLAPIYTPNAKGRYVYLPEDMMLWRIKSEESYDLESYKKGHHFINADTEEWLTFIKSNKMVMLNEVSNTVDDIELKNIKLIGNLDVKASYELYTDDGISRNAKGDIVMMHASYDKGEIKIVIEGNHSIKTVQYDIITSDQKRHKGVYHV